MGTDKLSFAWTVWWIMTGSHVTGSDISHVTGAMAGSIFCAYVTGSCAISALVGPFHRK